MHCHGNPERDICQMGTVHQNHYEILLELQFYDFQEFPEIDADPYEISTKKSVAGELMKSGTPRPKNAITFMMECNGSQDIHGCIDHFVMDFIKQEVSPDFATSLGCSQAFVRFHLPTQVAEELPDFNISEEVMKVLLDRRIHLDFWFLR